MGKKVVRWICVGLAVVVALAAVWLIWFSMTKRNEEDEIQQPPVTQTDPAVPQDQEQPDFPADQGSAQPEQTPDQPEEQPGVIDEPEQETESVEDETTDEEKPAEDAPLPGENEGPIV